MSNTTINYYDKNASEYCDATFSVDMTDIYARFERYLLPGSNILDLGCGSGRDSCHFLKAGYGVTAIDASKQICILASRRIGQAVIHMSFLDIDFINKFDGIWACASLLHISECELEIVFPKLVGALKKDGVLYASWKYGFGERQDNERFFIDYSEKSIEQLIKRVGGMRIEEIWISDDHRSCSNGQKWLNILAKKSE